LAAGVTGRSDFRNQLSAGKERAAITGTGARSMGKIIVNNSITLDGVMQAPARADEDTRGGFQYGGWAIPYADPEVSGKIIAQAMASGPGQILLGRRTYEDFFSVWPKMPDNPFSGILSRAQKYVASTTLREPLPWENSTLLKGDLAQEVAALKQQSEKDIVILGSGVLIQSLMKHNLIDEYVLSIAPLVLGTGRKLFPDEGPRIPLELISSVVAKTGVVIATYHPAA
jgi:dihydrofolate reductase